MSDFGIKNMDQVAPVCNMYRGLLKVSSEKTDFFLTGNLISAHKLPWNSGNSVATENNFLMPLKLIHWIQWKQRYKYICITTFNMFH